uniref:Uncharacterized protein n=1 Tax=Hemiselmis tepida TaxID=464990 RepID=A0A7S0VR22_9CRYP
MRILPPMPWDPYVEALPPMPWEGAIQGLADQTGFATDQLRYTSSLLVAIPVGFLFRALTMDPYTRKTDAERAAAITGRHTLSMLIGLSFMLFAFGYEIAHALFSSTVAFLLMKAVPGKNVHIWVSIWAMGYMSVSHIYRQIVAYGSWTIDFTTPQLLLTQKMMNIAFALHDSSRKDADLNEEQRKRQIRKPLSFTEYYGYIFCMHTLLAGPSADYTEYIQWIDGSKLAGQRHSPLLAVGKKVLCAVFCLWMFIGLGASWSVTELGNPDWVSKHAWWWVLTYNQVALCMGRHRYYFAWVLSDAACNAAGFGFNGVDARGAPKWDAVLNIRYLDVEAATNFRAAMTGWNIATSNWLRRCVYERVPAAYATFASFTMSAIWHGFYPGYYLTFLSSALFNETAKVLRRHIRPRVIPSKEAEGGVPAQLYHFASTSVTMMSLNYLGHPFNVQSLDKAMVLWRYWGMAPHFIAITLFLAVPVLLPNKRPSAAKKAN